VPDTEFSLALRVYIEDTDAGGIVYYVNYLKYMERARTEFMRSLGYGKNYIFSRDLMFVVRDVTVAYHRPAQLDDPLDVTASVLRVGAATLVFRQTVRRAGELLAGGEITIACVDREARKPQRLPPEMAQRLRAVAEQPG